MVSDTGEYWLFISSYTLPVMMERLWFGHASDLDFLDV